MRFQGKWGWNSWAGGIGLRGLEGGGSSGWVGVGENPIPKAHELIPSPMAQNVTSPGLSNVEPGDH